MTWRLQGRSVIMDHDETLELLIFKTVNYEHGKPVVTLLRKEPFRVNVQPVDGRELLLVPEHKRFIEQYDCFIQGSRFEVGERAEGTGEVVLRGKIHFQVQSVQAWGSYQLVRIMRVDIGPYQTP